MSTRSRNSLRRANRNADFQLRFAPLTQVTSKINRETALHFGSGEPAARPSRDTQLRFGGPTTRIDLGEASSSSSAPRSVDWNRWLWWARMGGFIVGAAVQGYQRISDSTQDDVDFPQFEEPIQNPMFADYTPEVPVLDLGPVRRPDDKLPGFRGSRVSLRPLHVKSFPIHWRGVKYGKG